MHELALTDVTMNVILGLDFSEVTYIFVSMQGANTVFIFFINLWSCKFKFHSSSYSYLFVNETHPLRWLSFYRHYFVSKGCNAFIRLEDWLDGAFIYLFLVLFFWLWYNWYLFSSLVVSGLMHLLIYKI